MNSFEIAKASLKQNIMTLPSGRFLTAGQNQFQTLWSRDFCHAIPGLIAIGEKEVAENHLTYLLKNLREDGLVPRVLDNHKVQLRVAFQSLRKSAPFLPKLKFNEPLIPQYQDEHGSNAFDSNILLILGALHFDHDFWTDYDEELGRVWEWYEDKFQDGLIEQSSFSDWQDTTKREGRTFLLNLFYFMALPKMLERGFHSPVHPEEFKKKIKETFLKEGLFLSLVGSTIVSVEGNLFALLDENFLDDQEKKSLWQNLKKHPVVGLDGVIGRCSYPDWPKKDLAIHIKLARLSRYHGSLTWSWLLGLGLKAAFHMNDQEMLLKQKSHIDKLLSRDQEVYEVYDPLKSFKPWGSWLIQSEHPFAWGSAYLVEALKLLDE